MDKGKKLYSIRITLPGSVCVEYVKAYTPAQAVTVLRMRLDPQQAKCAKLELC